VIDKLVRKDLFNSTSSTNLGSIFSGNFRRRSGVPFLDQLAVISIADVRRVVTKDSPIVYVPHDSAIHPVRLLIVRAGITDQLRFCCPACARRCSILYLGDRPKCNRCSGRYRVQSESPSRRAERRARKVLERAQFDNGRPDGKIAWRRWKTHRRAVLQVTEAVGIVCGRYDDIIDSLKRSHKSG
jgi:hypothetical protein